MCQKEKAWPKKGKINASAKGTHVEDTATRVSKKTRNDEKGTESLAETMDPRGAIQPQTLVGPDEEAEQLTMSFRNLVPELRGFETFGATWSYVELFRAIWSYLELLRAT